jgi:hypothetical protein
VAAQQHRPGSVAVGKSLNGSGSTEIDRKLIGGGSVVRPLVLSEIATDELVIVELNDGAGKKKAE